MTIEKTTQWYFPLPQDAVFLVESDAIVVSWFASILFAIGSLDFCNLPAIVQLTVKQNGPHL